MLVQMERQIDREIAADQRKLIGNGVNGGDEQQNGMEEDSDSELEDEQPVLMYGPLPQIVTNDLKSLDEMVSDVILNFFFKSRLELPFLGFLWTRERQLWRWNCSKRAFSIKSRLKKVIFKHQGRRNNDDFSAQFFFRNFHIKQLTIGDAARFSKIIIV